MQQPCPVQFTENTHDAARPVDVFHVDVFDRGRDLAQHRNLFRQTVDVIDREADFAFMGRCQKVQDRVGGSAHGDIEAHGVLERLEVRNVPRQHAFVVLLVVAFSKIDDQMPCFHEKPFAICVGSQRRAVARQGQTKGFRQAVHGVRREHARAGSTCRAGILFHGQNVCIGHPVVGSGNHCVDQVDRLGNAIFQHHLAGFHRPAGNEDNRNVEPHGSVQHARGNLVAVGNTYQRICAMAVDHVFDRIGNHFARGQRIEHAIVTHGDTVIDRDGVEFLGDTTSLFHFSGNQLAEVLQMDVARHKLCEGVGDGDDRLAEVVVLHAGRAPKAARTSHVAAVSGCSGTIRGIFVSPYVCRPLSLRRDVLPERIRFPRPN